MNFKTPKGTELPFKNIQGKDYLQVAHRLIWFREDHPNWSIETEIRTPTPDSAIAKATIKDESGRVVATAHKTENVKGFGDFVEKAETGAIGRALALCGFGTQFAQELEEGERIVDSPIMTKRETAPPSPLRQAANVDHRRDQMRAVPNAATYTIPFGKFQGMTFSECDNKELRSYVSFLKKSNESPTGKMAEFISLAEEFLST